MPLITKTLLILISMATVMYVCMYSVYDQVEESGWICATGILYHHHLLHENRAKIKIINQRNIQSLNIAQ